jgi:hypothetical protein
MKDTANASSDDECRHDIKKLFALCEVWVAGAIRNHDFRHQSLALRKKLVTRDWGDDLNPATNQLMRQFNLAVSCALAVDLAMQDLAMLSQTDCPPLAMRAFYFGARVSDKAVFELENVLRVERAR